MQETPLYKGPELVTAPERMRKPQSSKQGVKRADQGSSVVIIVSLRVVTTDLFCRLKCIPNVKLAIAELDLSYLSHVYPRLLTDRILLFSYKSGGFCVCVCVGLVFLKSKSRSHCWLVMANVGGETGTTSSSEDILVQ